jgi:hypothetical protein
MAGIASSTNLDCIGYFEEPESGVPTGYTGWYHSYGNTPIRTAADVFESHPQNASSVVKPGIAGPFTAKLDALNHLEAALGN